MISSYPAKKMFAEYKPLSYPEILTMSASFPVESLSFSFATRTMGVCRALGSSTSGLKRLDGQYFRTHSERFHPGRQGNRRPRHWGRSLSLAGYDANAAEVRSGDDDHRYVRACQADH